MRMSGPFTSLLYLFMWGSYLLFGPVAFIGLLVSFKDEKDATLLDLLTLLGVTGAITVVGFWMLRGLGRHLTRPLWYRR